LRGQSAETWTAACEQLAGLWTWYGALSATVDSVEGRRKAGRTREPDRRDMWWALTGPSIEVSAESIQRAARGLSDSPELTSPIAVTPLIAAMNAAYKHSAEAITSVCAVWDLARPRLGEIDAAIAGAESMAGRAELRLPNELGPVRARLGRLQDQAARDPLAADLGEITELERTVTRLAGEIKDQADSVRRLEANLEGATGAVKAIAAVLRDARARHTEVAVKIDGPIPAVSLLDDTEAKVDRLMRDLQEAAALAATDRARAVRMVAAFGTRVEDLRGEASAAAERAGRPLARRRELRGLLDAYVAKAYSLGRGEDVALEALHRHAEESLYRAPCDLAEAQHRVEEYQHAVINPSNEDRSS
jgi:hypothetical protein